jgi:hypothetical protein
MMTRRRKRKSCGRLRTIMMQPDPAYIRASSTVSQCLAEASEKYYV